MSKAPRHLEVKEKILYPTSQGSQTLCSENPKELLLMC